MTSISWSAKILRGTIFETERGLFQINYRAETADSGVTELPTYQVGTCVLDAKQQIEKIAQGLGFDAVVWDHACLVPSLERPPSESALSPPGALPAAEASVPERSAKYPTISAMDADLTAVARPDGNPTNRRPIDSAVS